MVSHQLMVCPEPAKLLSDSLESVSRDWRTHLATEGGGPERKDGGWQKDKGGGTPREKETGCGMRGGAGG